MKKFTTLAMFLTVIVSMALAQTNMFVWIDGIKTTYPIALVDSVTFGNDDVPIEGIGIFSVSEGKTVTFSPGNLQYHPANDEWRFAESQLDYIGDANSNYSSTYNGWLDLFGWSTSSTNFGVSSSADWENDDSGNFVDWGTNQIGIDAPNTWRTLIYEEWDYLLNTRANASALWGIACVNGVNGLVFLPDNWTSPTDVVFKPGFHSNEGIDYYADYQIFTAYEWSKLEAAGAVFLSASGDRIGLDIYNARRRGFYWSASGKNNYIAYYLCFSSNLANIDINYHRDFGSSVRLVKDINNTTLEPPIEPSEPIDSTIYYTVTICEGEIYTWNVNGQSYNQTGTYTHEEIIEEGDYIYHYIYTLDLWIEAYKYDTIWVEAYDSYEWHGEDYTESGQYQYYDFCSVEVLNLTIIETPTEPKSHTLSEPR